MTLFDGKKEAEKLEDTLKTLVKAGDSRVLAIIQIGENPSSLKYIQLKMKLCDKLGIKCELHNMDALLSKEEIFQKVKSVFEDSKVGGGIIQLPLPDRSLEPVLALIPIQKDIDMLSTDSQEKYYSGDLSKLPPVVRSIEHFIKTNELDVRNMKVAVLGSGFLVGKPAAYYLHSLGAIVDVIDDYKRQKPLNYQLIVLSAGIANLVDGSDIQRGGHVIDFGSTIVDGKTYGDLDMNSQIDHLGIVSPSPGGMGPLVVRYLVKNYLEALK